MTLVIAEKPSVAREIAAVLGANAKQDGFLIGGGYIVTWCVGHLVETALPEEYDPELKKWRLNMLPIIPDTWKVHAIASGKKQLAVIGSLMKRADVQELICATDAGREGELIFRLVYHHMNCRKPFKRLWISSMEAAAIKQGFADLKPSAAYDSMYQAALCRQRADWLIGINCTRLFSLTNAADTTLHVGRVQTPTLALIMARQQEISNFKAKTYYRVTADFGTFCASLKTEDKDKAERLQQSLAGRVGVAEVKHNDGRKENAPALYDLTTLQRDANRLLGLSAQQTLDIAQELYEKKLLTYPRTDSRYITDDMAARTVTLAARLASVYGLDIKDMDAGQIVNAQKVSDHHAILPVAADGGKKLTGSGLQIYTLAAFRLMEALSGAYRYSQTDVTLDIDGAVFTVSGKHTLDAGFKTVREHMMATLGIKTQKEKDDPGILPDDGERCIVQRVSAEAKKTQPPKPYTEDSLLEAMEHVGRRLEDEILRDAIKKGLGTPATRAATIEKLVIGQYVERKGKQLCVTNKAVSLLSILPERLKSPELTAGWEHQLELIAAGQSRSDDFMNAIAGMVRELVKEYASVPRRQADTGDSIGACPWCGGAVTERNKMYACADPACGFAIWKDNLYFQARGVKLTGKVVSALLAGGYEAKGLKSKAGKNYDAKIILKRDGEKVRFDMAF